MTITNFPQTDVAKPCTGRVSVYYGHTGERPEARDRREAIAKKLCANCPISEECRNFARQTGEIYGIWGGETERERHYAGYITLPVSWLRGERDKQMRSA